MASQKLEDILNLSLASTPDQRQRSGVLEVGFDTAQKTWELIVKYSGSLEALQQLGIGIEELLSGYAIVTVPEALIPALTTAPQIEYVEMPKNLLNGLYQAKQISCIPSGPAGRTDSGIPDGLLSGRGVLVAVLDSGIDYYLPDFRNPDGSSRIAFLWDQTLDAQSLNIRQSNSAADASGSADGASDPVSDALPAYAPPEGFLTGVEFSKARLDQALATGNRESAFFQVPSLDRSGHGTAVAAIAAGSNPDPMLRGVASGSQLLIVKLANRQTGFPHTTALMRGVQWALLKARQLGMPLAVNISFGNSYGPHDGSSLLARFLDNAAESGRTAICVGSGNEGASLGHTAGRLSMGQPQTVQLVAADFERTLNIQLWKNYTDQFTITLRTPSGQQIPVQTSSRGKQDVLAGNTEILIYTGQPSPYSVHQEIFFDLLPRKDYIDAGIWSLLLTPVRLVDGSFQLYLPGQEARAQGTRFVRPTPELTLTIPGTAAKVITVGASQQLLDAYADFSGRGTPPAAGLEAVFTNIKPDLIAPGVNLFVPGAGGGTLQVSGTSFSTPLVCGSAALLMEWGIVRGNDPYLYGEKIKAFLQNGAKPVRGEAVYPNERVGYGVLCVRDSIPV